MKVNKNHSGFGVVETFLVLAVVIILSFVGWIVWQKTQGNGSSKGYLIIKEWNVKVALTKNTGDAYYQKYSDDSIHVSTHKLDNLAQESKGCNAPLNSIYMMRNTSYPGDHYSWPPRQINGYYYYPSGGPSVSYCASITAESENDKLARPILIDLDNGFKNLSAL